MFILTKFSDLVEISPNDFTKPSGQCIEDNINAKYANKVVQNIGLCICLFDLISASEGLIGHGTGIVNVNVEFRLIVFRPFKHEILFGRIKSANLHGIRLQTEFFDEFFVPAYYLPEGSSFDATEQIWVLRPPDDPESPLYFDKNDIVRFKIESEEWVDQSPIGPADADDATIVKESPYKIIASMVASGTGPIIWWDADEEDEHMAT